MLRRKSLLITLLCYFAAALVATSAFAEPPVPGWRGDEGSTFQEWGFGDDIVSPSPEPATFYNPYATGDNLVLLNVNTHHGWYDSIENTRGVWALSGEIDIVIPNRPVIDGYKDIFIELVWRPEHELGINGSPFLSDFPNIGIGPDLDPSMPYDIYKSLLLDEVENGWHRSWYLATIWPNPPREFIFIKGNILVDYLAIDTICVPEPTTIAFITAGGLIAVRRKKRGK